MKTKINFLIMGICMVFLISNVLAVNSNQYSIRGDYLDESFDNLKIRLNINGNKNSGQGHILFSMNNEYGEYKGSIKLTQISNDGNGNLGYKYFGTYHSRSKYYNDGKWVKENQEGVIYFVLGDDYVNIEGMMIPITRLR